MRAAPGRARLVLPRTPVDLDLDLSGVALKLPRGRIAIEDKDPATGAGRVLKQGFERFSILGHRRPTRRAPVGLSEAAIVPQQQRILGGRPI
jgi:hypothetical protein